MRGRHICGFTLIELMISIALVVITLSIGVSTLMDFGALTREVDYDKSLKNANAQLRELRQAKFDSLPPEILEVNAQGEVQLSRGHIIAGTLSVARSDSLAEVTVRETDPVKGTVRLNPTLAGQKVIVNYRFQMADRSEVHFADENLQIRLSNRPVKKVESVWLVEGEVLTAARFELSPDGLVTVDKAKPGQLIAVDYWGGRLQNRVQARFLNSEFQESQRPTELKELIVSEKYGGGFRLSLPLLKVVRHD